MVYHLNWKRQNHVVIVSDVFRLRAMVRVMRQCSLVAKVFKNLVQAHLVPFE